MLTSIGRTNFKSCLAYTTPGYVLPMIAGNSELANSPGTIDTPSSLLCMGLESPVSFTKASISVWVNDRLKECTVLCT